MSAAAIGQQQVAPYTRHTSGFAVTSAVIALLLLGGSITAAVKWKNWGTLWLVGMGLAGGAALLSARCAARRVHYKVTDWQALRMTEEERAPLQRKYDEAVRLTSLTHDLDRDHRRRTLHLYRRLLDEHNQILENVALRAHSFNETDSYFRINYQVSFGLLNAAEGDYVAHVNKILRTLHEVLCKSSHRCTARNLGRTWNDLLSYWPDDLALKTRMLGFHAVDDAPTYLESTWVDRGIWSRR